MKYEDWALKSLILVFILVSCLVSHSSLHTFKLHHHGKVPSSTSSTNRTNEIIPWSTASFLSHVSSTQRSPLYTWSPQGHTWFMSWVPRLTRTKMPRFNTGQFLSDEPQTRKRQWQLKNLYIFNFFYISSNNLIILSSI